MNKKTFIKITNQNIYDEIINLKNHVKETNGKVKLNRWIATTALAGLFMWVSTAVVTAGAVV